LEKCGARGEAAEIDVEGWGVVFIILLSPEDDSSIISSIKEGGVLIALRRQTVPV